VGSLIEKWASLLDETGREKKTKGQYYGGTGSGGEGSGGGGRGGVGGGGGGILTKDERKQQKEDTKTGERQRIRKGRR